MDYSGKRSCTRMKLQLLGRFALYIDGQEVTEALHKSKIARALISLLALHRGNTVSFEEIYDTIAFGKHSKAKWNSVKVLASRTRALLGGIDATLRACIESRPGGYGWNIKTAEVDVLQLHWLCEQLDGANGITSAVREMVQALAGNADQEILPEFGAEAWLEPFRQELRVNALQAAMHVIPMLEDAGEQDSAEALCKALKMKRKKPEASAHIRALQAFTPPVLVEPKNTQDSAMEETLDEVELDLVAYQQNEGALLCEYDTFRRVYEFQRRGLSKYRQSFYIAVIKLRLEDEHREGLWTVAEGMQWMGTVLKGMLSQSDTVARYAATQYVALIQEQEVEQVQRKLQVIQRRFSQGEGTEGLRVSCEYRKLPGYRPQSERMQQALRG